MKKVNYLIALMALIATLVACDKNLDAVNSSNFVEKEKQTEILTFKTKNDLERILSSGLEYDSFNKKLTETFSVINSATNKELTRSENVENQTTVEVEDLVPNKNLRNLLNKDGLIIVNDTLYKIEPQGTFYCHVSNADELKNGGYMLSKEVSVGENTYKYNNVYRINTFENNASETFEIDTELGEKGVLKNTNPELRSTTNEPNFDTFPTFGIDRYTWLGILRQSIFGNDKWFDQEFPKVKVRTRIRARLYGYNYGFVYESGVQAKTQFKNWIGWSNFNVPEIRIGWENIVYSFTLGGKPERPTTTKFSDIHTLKMLAGMKKTVEIPNTIAMFVPQLTENNFNSLLAEGIKEGHKILRDKLSQNYPYTPQTLYLGAIAITDGVNIKVTILGSKVRGTDCQELSHQFYSGVKFEVSGGVGNNGVNINLFKSLMATFQSAGFKLESGKAFACARDGNNHWRGMKLVK
ncbi:MAG: hypothetical protein Q4G63_02375 [Bacteroidia bacterium]|nr:hypothetical protein [Bacteroidia bacterium]